MALQDDSSGLANAPFQFPVTDGKKAFNKPDDSSTLESLSSQRITAVSKQMLPSARHERQRRRRNKDKESDEDSR